MTKMLGSAAQWGWRDSEKADRRRRKNIEKREWQNEESQPHFKKKRRCRHRWVFKVTKQHISRISDVFNFYYSVDECIKCKKRRTR